MLLIWWRLCSQSSCHWSCWIAEWGLSGTSELEALQLNIRWKLSRPTARQMNVTSGTVSLPRGLCCWYCCWLQIK